MIFRLALLICSLIFSFAYPDSQVPYQDNFRYYIGTSKEIKYDDKSKMFLVSHYINYPEFDYYDDIFLCRIRADIRGVYFQRKDIIMVEVDTEEEASEIDMVPIPYSTIDACCSEKCAKNLFLFDSKNPKKTYIQFQTIHFKTGCFRTLNKDKVYMLKTLRTNKHGIYFLQKDINKNFPIELNHKHGKKKQKGILNEG